MEGLKQYFSSTHIETRKALSGPSSQLDIHYALTNLLPLSLCEVQCDSWFITVTCCMPVDLADKMCSMCLTIIYMFSGKRQRMMEIITAHHLDPVIEIWKSLNPVASNEVCTCTGRFGFFSKQIICIHYNQCQIINSVIKLLKNRLRKYSKASRYNSLWHLPSANIGFPFSKTYANVIYKLFHVCKCDKKKEAGNQFSAHVSSLEGIKNWWPVVIYLEHNFL